MRDVALVALTLTTLAIAGSLSGLPLVDLAEGVVLFGIGLLATAGVGVSTAALVWLGAALLDDREEP